MDLFNKEQKISLFFDTAESTVDLSGIVEGIEDDRLIINLPQYFMRYIDHLQVGCTLMAKAFSKFGTIDFNTIVISSPLEDCFSIELDYNSLKLTSSEDFPYIDAVENLQIKAHGQSYKLNTFAIAANYIKFASNNPFEKEEIIEGAVTLPSDYGIINFRAIISEIDPVYENEYTATFTTMTETDRQNLLYYMYMYEN